MSKTKTRRQEDSLNDEMLSVALELGERHWKVAGGAEFGGEIGLKQIKAGDGERLLEVIHALREKLNLPESTRIATCYEAGREGFWLDRFLKAHGVESLVVDSASIEVSRRARRAKPDRLDAEKLLTMLQRYLLGEERVWSVVRVPSVEEEDGRSLHREHRTLTKERTRLANRIRGLLANQGLRLGPIDGKFLEWLDAARLWDGTPVPPGLRKRIEWEFERWQFTHEQILDLERERVALLRAKPNRAYEQIDQLSRLKGIGLGSAWTYVMEFFAWREFKNGQEVGALAGLAPTPHQSGDLQRERGISRAGNRFVRGMAIEIAWGWLRHQPNSALTKWYEERFASGGPRARKVGIVAVARKLLIALWRYLETGALPEGAQLKTTA